MRRIVWTTIFLVVSAFFSLNTAIAQRTELHRGNVAEPDTLDPHKMTTTWENVIGRDLFTSLTALNSMGEVIPGSAETWEMSEDGLTYTYHLRDNLKWSDGQPITAGDFVAGLRRLLDPATTANAANQFYMIKNAEAVNIGALPPEELAVTAPDEKTVIVVLRHPMPTLNRMLGTPPSSPLPRHVYEQHGDKWIKAENIVSNGAYKLASWRAHDRIHTTKNEHFFETETVALTDIYYYPTDDYEAALRRFRAGELDMNGEFPVQQIEFLRENFPEETHISPNLSVSFLVLNNKTEPFNDPNIRRAISLAINRSLITEKVMQLGEQPAYRLTPLAVSDYHAPELDYKDTPQSQRVAEAKQLLIDAGYGPANPLTFQLRIRSTANGKRTALLLRDFWMKIGAKVDVLSTELKVHYNDLAERNFVIADAGWQAFDDPEYFLYLLRTDTDEQNYGQYSNPAYDAKIHEAMEIADKTERYRLLAEAEEIAMNEHGLIPIYFYVNRFLVGTHVKGFNDNPTNTHPSRYLSIEDETPS